MMMLVAARRLQQEAAVPEIADQETARPAKPIAEKPPPKREAPAERPPTLGRAVASLATIVLVVWILHARQFRAGALAW